MRNIPLQRNSKELTLNGKQEERQFQSIQKITRKKGEGNTNLTT